MNSVVAWLKLFISVIALVSLVWFLSLGHTPPGILGEVIRHNQTNNIDASPLFYSDVENMTELEEGLAELLRAQKQERNIAGK